eukprot:3811860-Amphidinium_carterae.1
MVVEALRDISTTTVEAEQWSNTMGSQDQSPGFIETIRDHTRATSMSNILAIVLHRPFVVWCFARRCTLHAIYQ